MFAKDKIYNIVNQCWEYNARHGIFAGAAPMDLKCFVYPGWEPRIRAGSTKRDWMDGAPDSYAYRCLPLNIANGHGWEMLSPCGFEATWNGGLAPQDVSITADEGTKPNE